MAIQTTKKVGAVVDLGFGKMESKQTNGDRDVGDTLVDVQPLKNTKEVLEKKRSFLKMIWTKQGLELILFI